MEMLMQNQAIVFPLREGLGLEYLNLNLNATAQGITTAHRLSSIQDGPASVIVIVVSLS